MFGCYSNAHVFVLSDFDLNETYPIYFTQCDFLNRRMFQYLSYHTTISTTNNQNL